MKQWVFLALVLAVSGANPGAQFSLSVDTVNEVLMAVYGLAEAKIPLHLGDYDYKGKSDFGDIDMKLSNIVLTSVAFSQSESLVSFVSPNVVNYQIKGLTLGGAAAYDIKVGLLDLTPGNSTFSLASTDASVNLTLLATNGRPEIAIGNNDFALSLGDFALHTSLPGVFNDMINDEIKKEITSIQSMIPSLLGKYLTELNTYLQSLDTLVKCPVEPLAVSAAIALGPEVQGSLLVVGLDGTIYAGPNAVPGGEVAAVPAGALLSEGIQAALTDFEVNSLLNVLWPQLDYPITSLPAGLGLSLDTTSLAILLPQLRAKYGAGQPVTLRVFAEEDDSAVYQSTGGNLNLNASASVEFSVYYKSNWVSAVTLDFDLLADISAEVTDLEANAAINSLEVANIAVVQSNIGKVNTAMLELLLNSLLKTVSPELNQALTGLVMIMQKLPLPAAFAKYVGSNSLQVAEGYIVLGVDLALSAIEL